MCTNIWASLVAELVKNLPAIQETQVQSWVGEIPWIRKWQPTPVFLLGKSHGQRSLEGYGPWGTNIHNLPNSPSGNPMARV